MQKDFQMLEFDPDRNAIINPELCVHKIDFPERAVACFFHEVIDKIVREEMFIPIDCQRSEMGPLPIYEITINNRRIAFFHPGLGARFAGAMAEDVIAYGAKLIIACRWQGA